jgi:hypothetical protein
MSTRWTRRIAGVLAAAGLLLGGCSAPGAGSGEAAPAAGEGSELTARRGAFERRVILTGTLEAARAVAFSVPRTPQWQVELRWMAEDGAAVRAGETVVELDKSAFGSDLEEKELALQGQLSELERRRAEVLAQTREKEFAMTRGRAELEKAELEAELPEGIVPRQELEERRLALARARLKLEKAEADLAGHRQASAADLEVLEIEIRKARREIDAARSAIAELTLAAPIDGIFLVGTHPWEDRKLQTGDTVWVGLTVGTIPDLDSLVVEARLPDVDDGSIAPGMSARVVLDTYPERTFAGTVREVAQVAQDQGEESFRRFFKAVIDLEEPDPARMIPGMSARVEVVAERREEALLAPRAALALEAGPSGASREARVALAAGGAASVRLGPCNELECVVEEGLEPGTRLAAAGPSTGAACAAPEAGR